mmetsp:Transcript_982/g.1237  ORF Transcript_982/g.1237 Transcript_982/m.1237 type:complete len:410 (-) Transcript_982:1028-2257(-)
MDSSRQCRDGPVIGLCTDFCPSVERKERQTKGEIDGLEDVQVNEIIKEGKGIFSFNSLPPLMRRKTCVNFAVKKYRRSAAGSTLALPKLIRTPETLKRTAYYLIEVVLMKGMGMETLTKSLNCAEVFGYFYNFISNRFKAIRQDFVIQGLASSEYVECVEIQTRFEMFALFYFKEPQLQNIKYPFYRKLCLEQIKICLSMLPRLYHALRQQGGVIKLPNESEFTSYSLLMSFDFETHSLNKRLQTIPYDILCSQSVKFALQLIKLGRRSEYFSFLRILKHMPPMYQYFLSMYVPRFQVRSLKSMNKAYTKRETIGLDYLSRLLQISSVDLAIEVCQSCHLSIEVGEDDKYVTRFGSKEFSDEAYTLCKPWDFLPANGYSSITLFDVQTVVYDQILSGSSVSTGLAFTFY